MEGLSTVAERAESSRIPISDRVIGTVFLVAAATSVIAGRSTVVALAVLTLAALAFAYVERNSFQAFLRPAPASIPVIIFLGFAALSAAWSADAGATLAQLLTILLIFLQWHVVRQWLALQPSRRIRHLAYWFVIAVLIGLAVLLHEVYAEQYIRRWLVDTFGILVPPTPGKHYWVDNAGKIRILSFETNRSIAVLNMYVWPAVLCALSFWSGRKYALIAAALVGGTLLATLGSDHETSKLAAVGALLCFLLASFRLRAALVLVVSAWIVLGLAVVPAVRVLHDGFALHQAEWLQFSAQRRIEIWDHMADRALEAPVLGVGVRSAHVLTTRSPGEAPDSASKNDEAAAQHAHNVYLQNWYELGGVGVLLFLGAGLVVLNAIRTVSERAQPYALATFTAFMVEIASSWEIWQRWFAALFALTLIHLFLAIRSAEAVPEPET